MKMYNINLNILTNFWSKIMSMNLFFRAFTQPQIDEMEKNHVLIDKWVEEDAFSIETDIETAWDVLADILEGAGIWAGKRIDEALYNGCALISMEEVKAQAQELTKWTHEQVLEKLHNLDEESDLYHLEIFQEEEEYLLEQFDKLVDFYQTVATRNLAALSYHA
jgi:transcriptional regulator of heat shock response